MEKFGKYQLRRRIGAGGMAEVFLARTAVAQGLAKELVIKKIHTAQERSAHFVSMFVDEAKIALDLNHPNIVQVFDFGQVGDTFFLAMEYVAGVDGLHILQELLKQKRRMPINLCAYVVQEMAKGLDYAHRKVDEFGEPLGIVHRDISPQNVIISWDGAVKIVDFGIARARGIEEEAGVIKGKYSYMAPEQARAQPVDKRADVYSAGVVLFELVCARPLFPGRGKQVLARVRAGEFPEPRSVLPDIPESLERIILKALATDPDERYQSARELQHALAGFQFEQAHSASDLVDSDTVAEFLAEVMAEVLAERKRPQQGIESASRPTSRSTGAALAEPDGHSTPDPLPMASAARGTGVGSLDDDANGLGSRQGSRESSRAPAVAGVPALAVDDLGDLEGLDEEEDDELDDGPLVEQFAVVDTSGGREKPIEVRTRKHVVVLEGHVRGYATLEQQVGAVRAEKLIEQFYEVARAVAYKHDSYVHRAQGGSITVLVGLPVAREDDASRTIRLGLALIDALDGIGHDVHSAGNDIRPALRLSVGIQRGNAAVVYRHSRAGKAELSASERSMARHLAKSAPGAEILVGSQVYRVARNDWYFEAVSIDRLTEADERSADDTSSATVYRLRGPKERAARLRERLTPMTEVVGRDLEMKALRDAYLDVINTNETRPVILVGEAGVGKRTVLNAFLSGIPRDEAVIIRGTTQVATALTPYALIADLARDMLGLAEGAEIREVKRRIGFILPNLYPDDAESREARTATAAVGILLGAKLVDHEYDSDEIRDRMVDIVLRIQQKMQPEKPIVLIGENLHWADDESLELLRLIFTLPRRRAVLGIVTARRDERVVRLGTDVQADILDIGELSKEASTQLITRRFAQDTEPSDAPAVNKLAAQIVERTGGNPFFIQEVLDSLIDRGVVKVQEWSGVTELGQNDRDRPGLLRWVSRDAPIQVPTSVESLLATRIDRLPLGQKQALIHAAVFGRTCTADAVAELLERSVRDELHALIERGLLLSGAEGHYSFRNDMSMSVAYGLLPAEDRPRLHRQAAAIIQRAAVPGENNDVPVIARHYELAGDRDEAAAHYMKAAASAIEVGGNGDALRLLGRAHKLLPADDHERLHEVHRQRERVLERLGRRAQRAQAIRDMHATARALDSASKRAHTFIREAEMHIDSRHLQDAEAAIAPALRLARTSDETLMQADALRLRAMVTRMKGDNEEVLALCEQALALCDDSRRGMIVRALVINTRGAAQWTMGRLEASIESFAETLIIYRMIKLARKEAAALNNMGVVFSAMGEQEEGLAHYKSALEILSSLGDRGSIATQLSNIGQAYHDLGDVERAERYLRKAMKLAEQLDDIAVIMDAGISMGRVHLARRDLKRARFTLARGLSQARAHADRYQEIRATVLSAMVQIAAGEHQNALDLARYSADISERTSMSVGLTFGHALTGVVLARMGRMDEAFAASSTAVRLLREQKRPERAEEILYYHAVVCEQAGHIGDAGSAIKAALGELADKVARLQDPRLSAMYRGVRIARAIVETHERLIGPVTEF